MTRQIHRMITLRFINVEIWLGTSWKQVFSSTFLWIPHVAPWSVSMLHAPLPTAFVLLGRAQKMVTSRFSGRL